MKRLISMFAMLSLVVAAAAFAKGGDEKSEGHSHSTAGAKVSTMSGEIIDAGCFLAHGASGAKHAECALKCASNGMPLMLLMKDGKAILLTPPHDNTDAYDKVKTMAGSMAAITGTMSATLR